jgi:vancomycin resistance protein YoaR
LSAGAPTSAARFRSRATRSRARTRAVARSVLVALALGAGVLVLGLAYAGSPAKIAEGVRVAGADVGGLTAAQAIAALERRAEKLEATPVTFVVGDTKWNLTPAQLGVEADWAAAVAAAQDQGEGFAPVRGLRRLQRRFFGADVAPPVQVFEPALRYAVGRIANTVDRPARNARIVLKGLRPSVAAGVSGRKLDRVGAETLVVRALAGLTRTTVVLPARAEQPTVIGPDLERPLAQVRTALSAPVRLTLGPTRWRVPRWRIAHLLNLPTGGSTKVEIGGPEATRWLGALSRRVNRAPRDAGFAVRGDNTVRVVPAATGRKLDVDATSAGLLAAALSPSKRTARVVVDTARPDRSTTEARAMGISRLVTAYTTTYGGEPNRLHNVRLVAQLIDGALVAPGAEFSFNRTTGERTAEKGFLEAPVIINGELQTGLGGGVCQVSTTVFNAAYEAGLPITERTNHALYIDHYPLGRDATVNYPDLDLRFRNDTGKWLLVRTWVGASSLTVALYGRPVGRRVETEASPLAVTGPPLEKRVADPNLYVGETALEDSGEPSRSTKARRRVYDSNGKMLYDTTWTSWYRAEPRVVRYGTKPRPAPPPPPATEPTTTAAEPDAPSGKKPKRERPAETGARATPPPPPAPTPGSPGP